MNKSFGFRGMLKPQSLFKDVQDNILYGNILIFVNNGIMEVGYDREDEKSRALKIANLFIANSSKRNNTHIDVDFNEAWRIKPGGNRDISISVGEEITLNDRVVMNTVSIMGVANIVNVHSDSYSFTNDIESVRKAVQDETLALALKYYHEEVVSHKRPMYGIHKAIEQIIKHMPGKSDDEKRNNLAAITGYDRTYIDELMESIQVQRHSEEYVRLKKVRKIITDQECIERAVNIIDKYSASLS